MQEVPYELTELSAEKLHQQAQKYTEDSHHLVFTMLPSLINKIIEENIWNKGDCRFKNFGEYVLTPSPYGLGITNNKMLWLLKLSMDAGGRHTKHWGDVLNEVDGQVRSYARENKISVKDLSNNLNEVEAMATNPNIDNKITYLPSRSKSNDGHLLKLRYQDEETYNKVIAGEVRLKEALPTKPKKQIIPIELVKNKFNSLSEADRRAFLQWIEEQKDSFNK